MADLDEEKQEEKPEEEQKSAWFFLWLMCEFIVWLIEVL